MKNHNRTLSESKYPVNKRNARFMVYVNGAHIKIKLKPGQCLRWTKHSSDDEGYGWEADQWTYEDGTVENWWGRGGQDCDGYSSESGKRYCPINKLQKIENAYDPFILMPEWESGKTDCYDQYAVASNY